MGPHLVTLWLSWNLGIHRFLELKGPIASASQLLGLKVWPPSVTYFIQYGVFRNMPTVMKNLWLINSCSNSKKLPVESDLCPGNNDVMVSKHISDDSVRSSATEFPGLRSEILYSSVSNNWNERLLLTHCVCVHFTLFSFWV